VLGVPASAREAPTNERHHAMIRRTAESYARKAQLFKEEGLGGVEVEGEETLGTLEQVSSRVKGEG